MKQALVAICLILLTANLAFAQAGAICLFSDPDGNDCFLSDDAPGVLAVYVVHTLAPGATASEFAAPMPACMVGATWLGDVTPFPVTLGDSQNGVSIGYGACLSSPIHVLTINYAVSGTTTADCAYSIIAHPTNTYPEMVDCNSTRLFPTGGTTYINSNLACECEEIPVPPELDVSPETMIFGSVFVSRDLEITNLGGSTLVWSITDDADWLTAVPSAGTDNATVVVTVDRSALPGGNYSATLSVTSNGGDIDVPVSMSVVANEPVLVVSPTSLDFGVATDQLTFSIQNGGAGTLSWTVTEAIPWLTALPSGGSGNAVILVTVDRTGLADGTYNGVIDVTSNGGNATVDVAMTVAGPLLSVSPTSLDFGTTGTNRALTISNDGGGTLTWAIVETIPWLDATPTSGSGQGIVTVTVDRSGLAPGPYSGVIDVTSNGGDVMVSVAMEVPEPTPILGVSPASLTFPAETDELPLDIFNSGTGDLIWNIASDQPWLSVAPDNGVNDTTVSVSVDRTGLPDGTYMGMLSITSNGGSATVPVMMTVSTVPVLSVNPTTLFFSPTVTSRTFDITNIGVGTLEWSLSDDQAWISIDPPLMGSGDATVTVNVDPNTVPPGVQTGSVFVTSNGGDATVTVRYTPPPPSVPGTIGLYRDPFGNDCELLDISPGLLRVFVIHGNTPGATASQFSAPMPLCMTGAVYLADEPLFGVTIGNSQTGVAIGYGGCLSSPIHILSIVYFGVGLSETCCQYPVLPDPNVPSGLIEVVDCANNLLFGFGETSVLNSDGTCFCAPLVHVEETTWGRVKAMYAPKSIRALER